LRIEPLEDRRLLSITVDTLVDENDGVGVGGISLRDAIAAATAGETIDFSVTGTITLEHGELVVDKDLTIAGPGANLLTIDADGASRVFLVNDNDSGTLADVRLQDLTITGGLASDDGDGGGIWNRENLSIVRSVVSENQGDDGGGLYNFGGQFTIVDSTFSGNGSTDTQDGGGGGIFNFSEVVGQTSRISNSTISDNATSSSEGNLTSNNGGGIYNFLGTLIVEFSTITQNEASADKGSGIATLGDTNYAITRVYSSIIAGNVNSDVDHVVATGISFQSLGFNVIGFGTETVPFTSIGDQRFVADPMLGSLADNGGSTPTHALLAGSPAIDAGDFDAVAGADGAPEFDQRGLPFGRVTDGDADGTARIDVGSYESHALAYVVDTLDDEDDGIGVGNGTSLRDAINAANDDPGDDEIVFDPALFSGGPAAIDLLLGELTVTDDVTIAGPGAEWLTINARQNSRIFRVDDGDGFEFLQAKISGLTLTGGNDAGGGGAIFSQEYLTVTDSIITGSTANSGGGVYNGVYGDSTLLRSDISGNSATSSGGGLYNFGGTLTIRESTISGNDAPDAAGVHNAYYGYLAVRQSVVSGNNATAIGGGVKNDGTAIVEESRISGNEAEAGGGIHTSPYNFLSIARSTVSGNTATGSNTGGGGIFNNYAALYISDSTVSGNSASYGGGLYSAGPAYDSAFTRVSNSTISGNTATVTGGAMYLFGGSTAIEFSSITDNHAPEAAIGGIGAQHPSFARAELYHTILAGNDQFDAGPTAEINSFMSLGYNLVGVLGTNVDTFNQLGDQIIGTDDPLLGPLADNGGPTFTHALLPGSPAIDAGDPAAVAGSNGVPLHDQRGEGFDRVRDGDAAEGIAIDIGAFEVQEFVVGPELPGDYNNDLTVNAADYTVWRNNLNTDANLPNDETPGFVDEGDYQVWKSHFGESLLNNGENSAAPSAASAGGAAGVPIGDIEIQSVGFVDPFGNEIDDPVIGQKMFLKANWSFTGLLPGDDYLVRFDVDGVSLDSAIIEGTTGDFTYQCWLGGWFATSGTHAITVTVDADNGVLEANEANNSIAFQFTPDAPALAARFAWPVPGEQNVDWIFDGSVDLDPTFDWIDCAGATASTRDGHNGLDIGITNFAAMDAGVPVLAAAAGNVTFVDDGYFDRWIEPPYDPAPPVNIVAIDHGNGWRTEYYHLRRDSISVQVGDAVVAGQQIGLVGSSGYSFRPHVHWEVVHDDSPVDPFLAPTDYLESPPLHTFDAPKRLLAHGVTNEPAPPHQQFVEQVSSIDAFPATEEGISMVAWATIASLEQGDTWEVEFFRPDGTQLIDFGPDPIGFDGGWQSLVWYTFLPGSEQIGTWRADFYINEQLAGQSYFEVGPAEPEIRILREDEIVVFGVLADELIIDGRTTPVEFGTTSIGDVQPTQTFTVENHGYAPLTISGIDLPDGFSLDEPLDASIAAGSSDTFTVRLDANIPGRKAGHVVVHSNDLSELTTSFALEGLVLNPLPGDYNLDQTVNAADYTVWRNTLGASVAQFAGADGDGDGMVGPDDYGVWKAHFGESLDEPGAGSAADSAGGELGGPAVATTVARIAEPDNHVTGGSAANSAVPESPSLQFFVPPQAAAKGPQASVRGSSRALHCLAAIDEALVAWLRSRGSTRADQASDDDARISRGEHPAPKPMLDCAIEKYGVERGDYTGGVPRVRACDSANAGSVNAK
jgi:CSLREA domain-containing protein